MPSIICKTWNDSTEARELLRAAMIDHNYGRSARSMAVVFNGLHFDCPTLETHQRLDGLKPFGFDIRKYGSRNVIDLYDLLTFNGDCGKQILGRRLPDMARHFSIPVNDTSNGSDVATLIAAGDYETVQAHNTSDLALTAALYSALKLDGPAVVIDIETVAKDGLDRNQVKPDSRLTDPKKIEADIAAKLAEAALDPFASRIVVLGWLFIEA